MSGRVSRVAAPALLALLGAATGAAQAASDAAAQATGTIETLIGMAFLLWIVGNLLTRHYYNTRGPKGDKLPPAQ